MSCHLSDPVSSHACPSLPLSPPNSLPTHLSSDSTVCHATSLLLRDHGKGCTSSAGEGHAVQDTAELNRGSLLPGVAHDR